MSRGSEISKVLMALILTTVVVVSGCLSSPEPDQTGDEIFASAIEEYLEANYRTASALFDEAALAYTLEGSETERVRANNWKFRCDRVTMEFPYDRNEAREKLEEAFPDIPEDKRNNWLDNDTTERIISDGEVLYFEQFIQNIRFRNLDLIREMMEKVGHTPIFDSEYIRDIIWNGTSGNEGAYVDPVEFCGGGGISIPRDLLPDNGTLQVWIPAPVKTSSQVNIALLSIEPETCVVKEPDLDSDLGLAYLEIPLEEVQGDLEISIEFSFTEYEMKFDVDPNKVGEYDRESYEYIHYTGSSENIDVNDDIRNLALSVVGDETNPYLQAQKIYWYILENVQYSLVPHLHLSALGTLPESQYVHENGFGDCGAQSSYFCALCRSIGIPARDIGGNQLVPGTAGNHFWSEFLLPNYGWVPVDLAIAEIADWSFDATDEERETFKEFYFGNLDPYRFIIQKDLDVSMDPDPVNAVLFRTVHQAPSAVCTTSDTDLEIVMYLYWDFDIGLTDQ